MKHNLSGMCEVVLCKSFSWAWYVRDSLRGYSIFQTSYAMTAICAASLSELALSLPLSRQWRWHSPTEHCSLQYIVSQGFSLCGRLSSGKHNTMRKYTYVNLYLVVINQKYVSTKIVAFLNNNFLKKNGK